MRSCDGQRTPLLVLDLRLLAVAGVVVGDLEQALGGVVAPVEHDVLDAFAQLLGDLVVDDERAGVDDAHVEPGPDRVVQEDRVDGLAHGVVAAERERHVRDAAGHVDAGQVLLDPPGGLDEVDAVVLVLLDARGDREHVGVEDDVLGREADLVDQDPVGALTDLLAALEVVGLALLVERHDDRRRAVLAAQLRLLAELLLALLHGDRVDDRLALEAVQTGLDDVPLGGVDHHRHLADVGLRRHQLEEPVHRGDAVDHALVHVDVDDLRAVLDLLAGDRQRSVVVAVADQVAELGRPGDVGALADVQEQGVLGDGERLETGQPQRRSVLRRHAGRQALDRLGDVGDVVGGGAATAAHQVDEAAVGEVAKNRGGLVGLLVVLAERVRESRVGIAGHEAVGQPRDLSDVGAHLLGAQGAVETHEQRLGVPDGVPERLGGLPGEGAPGGVGDGAGDDDRPASPVLLEDGLDGEDRRTGVQSVEDGLDEDQVGATVQKTSGGDHVGVDELLVGDVACPGVVDVRRDGRRTRGRAERTGDVPGPVGRLGGHGVARAPCQPGGLVVQLVRQLRHLVVAQRDAVGVEGVGLDDVGAGREVLAVDGRDDLGLGEGEEVVVALDVTGPLREPVAAVARLVRAVALDRRAHGTVEHENALAQHRRQSLGRVGPVLDGIGLNRSGLGRGRRGHCRPQGGGRSTIRCTTPAPAQAFHRPDQCLIHRYGRQRYRDLR